MLGYKLLAPSHPYFLSPSSTLDLHASARTQIAMPSSQYPPHPGSSSPFPEEGRNKHVHFPDSFTPSSFSIRIKLGPSHSPSSVIKISVEFEPGRMPRVYVRTKKASESRRRRRRRH